jgi:hypothetical protein
MHNTKLARDAALDFGGTRLAIDGAAQKATQNRLLAQKT